MSIRTQRSSTRFGAATIVAALIASLFAFASPAGAQQVVTVNRTSGPDRYATAAAIALEDFTAGERPVSNVILASGENFPDGLAAASLAGAANAPVLLTATNSLPASTATALATLRPETVHIVGGTAAVSAAVRAQLTGLGYTLNEISGANRYATAAEISEFVRTKVAPIGLFNSRRTVIIATGNNFPDALAAGAPSANGVHPILLTGATLPAETAAELTAGNVQHAIILGGTGAVPDSVKTAIEALGITTQRISGADRYATATALATVATTLAPAGFSFDGGNVFLVNGSTFADALTAGPWAARSGSGNGNALVLAGGQATLDYLKAKTADIATIRVIGGTAAVTEAQAQAAKDAATSATPTATITAFEGATGAQVTFSERVTGVGTVQRAGQAAVTCPSATCVVAASGLTATVTFGTALTQGQVITATGFATPATPGNPARVIPPTSLTVAAGTGQVPTATITAVANNDEATVAFNRSVNVGGATITVTREGGGAPTATFGAATDAPFNTRFPINFSADLEAGDVISISGVTSSSGVAVPTFQRTVVNDLIAPISNASFLTVTGAGGVLNTTGTVATNINIQAKAIGPESTRISVDIVDPALPSQPLNVQVAVPAPPADQRLRVITVTLATNAAGVEISTPKQVADAINANAAASGLVTATPSDPASTTVVPDNGGPVALAAGSRSATVTTLWNEALRAPGTGAVVNFLDGTIYSGGLAGGVSVSLDVDGNGSADLAPAVVWASPTNRTDLPNGRASFTFTLGMDQFATAGSTRIQTQGVQDLAGNPSVFNAQVVQNVPAAP